MPVELSILIVSYNTRDWLEPCLTSLEAETPDVSHEVIVLDNASTDGSQDMLRERFRQVRLLAMDENLGFARGINTAAAAAGGRHLVFLNPDTLVHDRAVERLHAFALANPHHGIYGGRNLKPDGQLEPGSCWGLPTLWSLFCFATGLSTAFKDSPRFNPESMPGWARDTVREVGIISGSLMLVPQDLWNDLGGFDERFFMYGEDADFCMRAAARGLRPVITPDATITHAIGKASRVRSDKLLLLLRGKATLLRKHWAFPRRQLGIAFLLAGVGLRAALSRLTARTADDENDASSWRVAWARRREWSRGYTDPP